MVGDVLARTVLADLNHLKLCGTMAHRVAVKSI
jgi:hypothetical protein